MKHLVIIALGLVGLVAFLNYDRIRNHLHPPHNQGAQESVPMLEAQRSSGLLIQTNGSVAAMPTPTPTNAVATNALAAWQSATAQHYADLIKNIRSTRGN
jgi:hypothetical protein